MIRYAIPLCLLLAPQMGSSYPMDGYAETGIRRLEGSRLMQTGEIAGSRQPAGAMLPTAMVNLRLVDQPDFKVPPPDPAFSRQIEALLGKDVDRYGITVLDVSDPDRPRYAEVNGDYRQNVGSVGKLVAALGLFQALADAWPDESDRLHVLRERVVTADEFSHWDHHTVMFFDPQSLEVSRRTIGDGDRATLWEYLDWMLSPSSNSAAGMVMREALLIRQFGASYPPSEIVAKRFFDETSKQELTKLFSRTFEAPLIRNGIDLSEFRQGSFFTARGKVIVPGTGSSYATADSLMRFAVLMEKGQLVDRFTSLQLKRLLYLTERRIRYASSPELRNAVVYFKSGSLYSCIKEEGFSCGKYKGNAKNYMNSFAIIESPVLEPRLHYMVMLVSNVLRKNSAVDHQALGSGIHQVIKAANEPRIQTEPAEN